jgi:hypothetical protein
MSFFLLTPFIFIPLERTRASASHALMRTTYSKLSKRVEDTADDKEVEDDSAHNAASSASRTRLFVHVERSRNALLAGSRWRWWGRPMAERANLKGAPMAEAMAASGRSLAENLAPALRRRAAQPEERPKAVKPAVSSTRSKA